MAAQGIFTQNYIDELCAEVRKADKTFLNKYTEDKQEYNSKEDVKYMPNIKHPEGLVQKMIAAKDDFEAAKYLYEAYEDITLIQAVDWRFWIYLSHVDLRKYMQKRRPITNAKSKVENFILEHWIGKSGLMRHAIAGLWWSVKLTYDETRTDPYELTQFLFRREDFRTRRFIGSLVARNPEAMQGIIGYMFDHQDIYGDQAFDARSLFVIKYFNQLGGTLMLSHLNRDFFYNEMARITPEAVKYTKRESVFNNPHLFDNL